MKLKIEQRILQLPEDKRKEFCDELVATFYEPYWRKDKRSNPFTRMTNNDMNEARRKLFYSKYRKYCQTSA
jgi:hypothetical protein